MTHSPCLCIKTTDNWDNSYCTAYITVPGGLINRWEDFGLWIDFITNLANPATSHVIIHESLVIIHEQVNKRLKDNKMTKWTKAVFFPSLLEQLCLNTLKFTPF